MDQDASYGDFFVESVEFVAALFQPRIPRINTDSVLNHGADESLTVPAAFSILLLAVLSLKTNV